MTRAEKAEKQLLFCSNLMEHLTEDWGKNEDRQKKYSYLSVANGTQMASDARRIRRELLRFVKILEGGE